MKFSRLQIDVSPIVKYGVPVRKSNHQVSIIDIPAVIIYRWAVIFCFS